MIDLYLMKSMGVPVSGTPDEIKWWIAEKYARPMSRPPYRYDTRLHFEVINGITCLVAKILGITPGIPEALILGAGDSELEAALNVALMICESERNGQKTNNSTESDSSDH